MTDEWHAQCPLEHVVLQNPMQSNEDPCENDMAANRQVMGSHHHYNAPLWPPHNLEVMTADKNFLP